MGGMNNYFGRTYELVIGDRKFVAGGDTAGIDIRFNISDVTYGQLRCGRTGHLSILGLSYESMLPMINMSVMDEGTQLSQMLHVSLKAGFESTGMEDIIDGYATNPRVSSPPEMWLEFDVKETVSQTGPRLQIGKPNNGKPMRLGTLAEQAFKAYGVDFRERTTSNYSSKQIMEMESVPRTLSEMISAVSKMANWTLQLRGKTVTAYELDPKKIPSGSFTISKDRGLLAVSGIAVNNATVTTYLQPDNVYLQRCKIVSEMNPQVNNFDYQILSRSYSGHYRGREWFTTYQCARCG